MIENTVLQLKDPIEEIDLVPWHGIFHLEWSPGKCSSLLCTVLVSKGEVDDQEEDDDDLDKSLLNDTAMMIRWLVLG